ncbi:MAG: zf-TFIIB domain-containing protein [Cystobacter sp.]
MAHTDKPSHNEDDYFAREELELKRKLAHEQAQALAAEQRESLKKLHYMKCPKCGLDLHTLPAKNAEHVEIDVCLSCGGVFLDAGELERLQHQSKHANEGKWMGAVLNLFKNK